MNLLSQEQERRSFEHNFAWHWQRIAKPSDFDRPAEFWFALRHDGEYEWTRMRDAFFGWRLARANWDTDTIKSIERHVDRLQTEHLQMLVALEKCAVYFHTLALLGGLEAVQAETTRAIGKDIEALVKRVRVK